MNNKIGTLEELTKESFINYPHQAIEAVEEYLSNLNDVNPEKAKSLKKKLEEKKYLEQFKVAITHTSLIIFLMSVKAANLVSDSFEQTDIKEAINEIRIDFDKYVREFLLFARHDDKNIYDMRLFYLNGLTGKELGFDRLDEESFDSKDEFNLALRKAKLQIAKYDKLLNNLKRQYIETKIHLL